MAKKRNERDPQDKPKLSDSQELDDLFTRLDTEPLTKEQERARDRYDRMCEAIAEKDRDKGVPPAQAESRRKKQREIHDTVLQCLDVQIAGRNPDGSIGDTTRDIHTIWKMQNMLTRNPDHIIREAETFQDAFNRADGGSPEEKYAHMSEEDFPFLKKGGHLRSTPETNLRIMGEQRGYALRFDLIVAQKKRLPIGYIYGLLQTPVHDKLFRSLSATGLQPDAQTLEEALSDLKNIVYNNRTGVIDTLDAETIAQLNPDVRLKYLPGALQNESIRREGIGSIAKYVVGHLAQTLEKNILLLNVASIRDLFGRLWIPNHASEGKNSLFLEDWGWRKEVDTVSGISPGTGKESTVAVRLRVFGGELREMLRKLEMGTLQKKNVDTAPFAAKGQEFAAWIRDQRKGEH